MARQNNQDFQPPAVIYDPPEVTLAKLGFADETARAFIFAEAAIMKVDAGQLDIPENVAEVVKAAQYTRDYGLQPGIHLHMQTFNTKAKRKVASGATIEVWENRISLVVGEQAYKASARILAQEGGDHIEFEWEPLKPDELKAYVAENMPKDFELTEDDRGVRARVLSLKSAELKRAMGQKYDPPWSYGFCFMKGQPRVYNGQKSYPKSDRERIPNQRTALDVAIRRAVKTAIMQRYHLVPLDRMTEEQRINEVLRKTRHRPEDSWMKAESPDNREGDGDVLFYDEPQHRRGRQVEPLPADEDEIEGEFFAVAEAPDATPETPTPSAAAVPPPAATTENKTSDNPFDDPTAGVEGEVNLAYDEIADDLPDNLKVLAEWAADQHRNGNGPASKSQYGFLSKTLDDVTGNAHTLVLSVLCRRYVTGGNPCSADLASKLLDATLKQVPQKDANGKPVKDGKGKNIYIDNPNYRQDVVDRLAAIAKFAAEWRQRVAA